MDELKGPVWGKKKLKKCPKLPLVGCVLFAFKRVFTFKNIKL